MEQTEFIKTYCSFAEKMIELTLKSVHIQGRIVSGNPFDCNNKHINCLKSPLCLLKADKITTRRSKF